MAKISMSTIWLSHLYSENQPKMAQFCEQIPELVINQWNSLQKQGFEVYRHLTVQVSFLIKLEIGPNVIYIQIMSNAPKVQDLKTTWNQDNKLEFASPLAQPPWFSQWDAITIQQMLKTHLHWLRQYPSEQLTLFKIRASLCSFSQMEVVSYNFECLFQVYWIAFHINRKI